MSMDGSFCLKLELERLIARCPKLGGVPYFCGFLEKGHELEEEQVVNSLAAVLLHPTYTIPIMGCFRAIARKIVSRVVHLLRLVPNLKSDHPGGLVNSMKESFFVNCEELDDVNQCGVIEAYCRHGRFLDLHELASLAFCRVLDLAPFLKSAVESYYEFGGPPFSRIMGKTFFPMVENLLAARHLRDLVRTSYRFLLLDPEYFSSRWNCCCFLDLVHQCGSFNDCVDAELIRDIRWCSVQILCVLLRLPGRTAMLGMQHVEVLSCLLRWYEFCWDVSVEKAGWFISRKDVPDYPDGDAGFSGGESMTIDPLKLLECEPERFKKKLQRDCNPFLLTSSIKSSFERVILAVNQKWPVLLYGPPGCGKTALISKLAQETGNQVLPIHMDEQIDGRTLVGSYVCTEQPGEFRWQPGPLTQAVRNGSWVVFENIDQAASDVQSILLPLLEGGTSFLTGYGEGIRVAEGFRLFSTISTSKFDLCNVIEGRSALSSLWRRVMVRPTASTDLANIVAAWYPELESIAGKLTETFENINGVSESLQSVSKNSSARFSLRDLLKWCRRISGSGFSFSTDALSADLRGAVYSESVDVFAVNAASPVNRLNIMRIIAKMWAVPVPTSEDLYSLKKPVIEDSSGFVQIGRVNLQKNEDAPFQEKKPFVEIRSSFDVLERIACAVKWNEAVLLVGETGTGKTTLVQNLATRLGQKLTVLNLSQQSDVADLLGGFKPTDPQYICIPLYKEFESLFSNTFSLTENAEFLVRLKKFVKDKNWTTLLSGFQKGVRKVVEIGRCGPGTKRKRPLKESVLGLWENFSQRVEIARRQLASPSGMIFSFVEGAFVTALRNGEWILLDEINLAPPETLQRIIGVLDGESGSLCLAENGVFVDKHPKFRMFACMNPATDAGKRDLPYSLRSRFTEFFVDDVLDDQDLTCFVNHFVDDEVTKNVSVENIVRFYKVAKKESEEKLQDGANQKPQYSLRSLYRALEYIKKAKKLEPKRAVYDGFCMFFVTLLEDRSAELMNQNILKYLVGSHEQLPRPIPLEQLLSIRESPGSEQFLREYVITKSVEEHIRSLARAVYIKRYPVLLQGPTSSGKTSLVQYLAAKTGHEFVRINNHEHTDLQEYLGSYITDASGRLVFHEGVLVKAVRCGQWIVLDELNLAPSDVLEALNRLLDDNRELYVPELRETVRAHPNFMLFATQNPPTFYGGRKMLSRAFRNRFVEIHVDDIPEDELIEILEKKCKIPRSYAKKMIDVMKELQMRRQKSKVFAGKHGFITPRDLFRWANRFRRYGISYEDLAKDGYFLLAERLRDEAEKDIVQEVLEKHLRVKLKTNEIYKQGSLKSNALGENFGNIVWTKSMQRLYFLIERCYQLKEPVLLVGETGGGKTTVCQLLSMALSAKLHILNCHQYTETSDFIGGFYPVRERSRIASDYKNLIEHLALSKAFIHLHNKISRDISKAPSTLKDLGEFLDSCKHGLVSHFEVTETVLSSLEIMKRELSQLYQQWQTIFEWQDGPLVKAMKNGDLLLVDEISLADDSVLERLNSVLEPDRKLSLAEKGGPNLETVTAHPDFFLLATMNPGGDYGKKELSPALRNRFTEIWVPSVSDLEELGGIAKRFLSSELHRFVNPLINFWEWFNQIQAGRILTVRDLLAWLEFVRKTTKSLHPDFAFLHGSFLVLLDGLSLGTGMSKNEATEVRERCLAFLVKQLKADDSAVLDLELRRMENYGWVDVGVVIDNSEPEEMQCDTLFGIHPFYIEKGSAPLEDSGFKFLAPTTRRNVLRVLRAMQLSKPVLLEGSPGVGKTSLISAIGKFSGHKVVRINLSEQTDIMDLLGSDLPVESDEGLQFAWSDGILLQALKDGSWVLLDEINLAQQSVLEGLNAILDHRAEVFIPELGQSFKCPSSFRVFACQNPSHQGGGRKGLPKSFLNRFTKVYVDELGEHDYHFICSSQFPSIPESILSRLIAFNKRLYEETMVHHKFMQQGTPWEFNLRDLIRSCQIIEGSSGNARNDCFLNVVYVQRMRTSTDRMEVLRLYGEVFGKKPSINPYPRVHVDDHSLVVGNTRIKRNRFLSTKAIDSELKIFPGSRNTLEAAAQCIQQKWLCILVGPTSSGKTSLIRLLAHLTGNVLNEINLSSATDISELLGSFEQYNAYRNFHSIVTQVERYMNEYCNLLLDTFPDEFLRRQDLLTKWLSFSSNISFDHVSKSGTVNSESSRPSLSLLVEIIELLALDLESDMLPVSWSSDDLSLVLQRVQKLLEIEKGRVLPVKFEWAAGLLLKAIENGEWIVLEDANLCNPTVLDRINSLVESEGSITVNECGNVDGKPLVLSPHPNFRMFLTVNPSHGDVSRAMRNRGVEIVMMHPHWLINEDDKGKIQHIELDDTMSFLALFNIPSRKLVDSMAKAHMHARIKGLSLNVQITYLELGRWVHLFEQLLMTGNDVLWSLHSSWEHSYLSSLGETAGWHIVQEAKASYLMNIGSVCIGEKLIVNSRDACSKQLTEASCGELSLCLSGGWPAPLRLKDYVWYSNESSLRLKCHYLEYLGAQCAFSELHLPRQQMLRENSYLNSSKSMYLMDLQTLQTIMYPQGPTRDTTNCVLTNQHDVIVTKQKLLFATDWVIDQVTGENDLELYLSWFSWFGSQLQPFCHFFRSLGDLIREELRHPIWSCIFQRRYEMSLQEIDLDLQSLPILALESADVLVSVPSGKLLLNAINSVVLLRRSLWQWNAEINECITDKSLQSLVESLRKLEQEMLSVMVESPLFDLLHQMYTNLLEEHILFWNILVSSDFETLLVHWRALMKILLKLRMHFPNTVENLLRDFHMMSVNLNRRLPYSLNSEKSLLWAHGGHPSLPCSADVFNKLKQLVGLVKLVWPRRLSWKQLDGSLGPIAVSTNQEFRSLAMQGVCMTSSLIGKYKVGNLAEKLQEMYEMLLRRFECERKTLEVNNKSQTSGGYPMTKSSCCTVIPEVVNSKCGFEAWIKSLPIVDSTSLLLDLFLLQDLSEMIIGDPKELPLLLSGSYNGLQNSLDFSMKFSSRSPLDFVPHQEILWILEAPTTALEVGQKIVGPVLEMWFNWHSSLWNLPIVSNEELPETDACGFVLPDILFKPMKTDTVRCISETAFVMKDFHFHCLKLRFASSNIWQSIVPNGDLHSPLLRAARYSLLQIIVAHRKSFTDENFEAIKSIILSLQRNGNRERDDIKTLLSLLGSSKHQKFGSRVEAFIKPLLNEVVDIHSKDDIFYHLSCAWLRLGGLRFELLLACDELDPAIKYSSKYQKLVDKCKSLQLENEVRHSCSYLAGTFSSRKSDEQRAGLLEKLESECKRLQSKIVYRSNSGKFIKLKDECFEFSENVNSGLKLLEVTDQITSLPSLINQISNWQATASRFIDRLLEEYGSYIDIIRPIQVAVYEMKLGLSLLLSSTLQKDFLGRMQEDKLHPILDAIYQFTRFPLGYPFERQVKINFGAPEFPFYTVDFSDCVWVKKMDILKKLITSIDRAEKGNKVMASQLEASLSNNVLGHIAKLVSNTKILNDSSFRIVDKIFCFFTSLWSDAKVQEKTEKDIQSQLYKFRSRAFKLDNAYDIDLSSLSSSFSGDSFTEWKEMLQDEESAQGKNSNDEFVGSGNWNLIPESMLNAMVNVHNQFFGSNNLVDTLGIVQLSNADKLDSFVKSYTLGATLLKDIIGLSASSLDARLAGEHIFRLCLEHKDMASLTDRPVSRNFYKDPNPAVVASMVELLDALRQKLLSLLEQSEEHPGLQKLLDIVQLLLGLPSSTSIAQALSGLQFLVNQVKLQQENGAKFPLSGELEPLVSLISSFQKMEYDFWKTMLDDVLAQVETNADKLWFPLYLVLHREETTDVVEYTQSTLQSLEEFIRTSSIGEFKRRMQLMLSFYGQLNAGIGLGSYSSCTHKANRDVLYNVFGFYIQSLPAVMSHITTSTKNIKKELDELLKLCQWDRPEKLVSMENSKRNRQKLKKLMQKYTDVLQQPVMLVLSQEFDRSGLKFQKVDHSPVKDRELSVFDASQFHDRTIWYEDWKNKVDNAVQSLHSVRESDIQASLSFSDVDANTIGHLSLLKSPSLAYTEEWSEVWHSLEKLCRVAAESAEMWNGEGKSQVKMRAFTDLLKLLENHGLSKHKSSLQKLLEESSLFSSKSALIVDNFKQGQSNWWFFLPSYHVQHLLLMQGSLSSQENDANAFRLFKFSGAEDNWIFANQNYYKSLASVTHLQQISLNFHKDFNPDQVNRCNSFLEHLLMIQMEQRATVYDMRGQLQHLRRNVGCLKKMCLVRDSFANGNTSEIYVSASHQSLFKCMWQQKELFDTFCSVLDEESLMLEVVRSAHLNSCQSVKNAANKILLLIEKFSPLFWRSKVSLDEELLGDAGSSIKVAVSMHPVVVSKDMEVLVVQNFQLIRELQEHVLALRVRATKNRSVEDILLGHFEEVIEKANIVENEFNSSVNCNSLSVCAKDLAYVEAEIDASLNSIISYIGNALQQLGSRHNKKPSSEALLEKITSWKLLFDSFTADLRLDLISQELDKLISYVGKLPHISGLSSRTAVRFKQLEEMMILILAFSDGLLLDFLAVHEVVSILTHRLAEIFASLFSKGYGVRTEEVDDMSGDKTQDASGTGMGEGDGLKDVSDQITDEDQLLGTSGEKEEPNTSNELPSKNDKGIEMENDLDASIYNLSEDSGDEDKDDDNEDDEGDQLDREMGNTGDDSEIVDEKLWDKEDQNLENSEEKHDPGPSVKDKDPNNRELRAKDESNAVTDELAEGNEPDEKEDMDTSNDGTDDKDNMDSMNIDQKEDYEDPTDIQLNEPNQNSVENSEDMDVDPDNSINEDGMEERDNDMDNGDVEDNTDIPEDETLAKGETNQLGEEAENDDSLDKNERDGNMDLTEPSKDRSEHGNLDSLMDQVPNTQTQSQTMTEMQTEDSRNAALEMNCSMSSDIQNDLASSEIANQVERLLGNSSKGNLSDDQQQSQLPPQDLSSLQKNLPNPLRNLGDALQDWKDRVKVSDDVPKGDKETGDDDTEDQDADQFGFTSELDQGTAQALGSAMPDQMEHITGREKPDGDGPTAQDNELDELHNEDSNAETMPRHPVSTNRVEEKVKIADSCDELSREDVQEATKKNDASPGRLVESLVSLKKSYMTNEMNQPFELSANGEEPGKVQNLVHQLSDMNMNAGVLWRECELRTMRLSQELTEQLRLVMEPTLASKLQGDYRTGKRINMKKVIPYIASHYRKDKIWLRRTKPNKRDYQVMIVVDDSRSMSENCCGNFAIEALVTVCRALSQLEVGKLAVTSFGREGNIRLLHDFDQSLTGEAGMKMISSLTFNQENTLREEPMVELLKYLNMMLEQAVANARLPSGQNPLQQLVLIIADGRFHDNKEKVKRCMRDLLHRNCMVAFIVLDSAQESIVDCKDYIFKNGLLQKAIPYLDSFPFPYYIVLRNIEALPRTLADLLRQWFELMQNSRD